MFLLDFFRAFKTEIKQGQTIYSSQEEVESSDSKETVNT